MKKIRAYALAIVSILAFSCEDYLDKSEFSEISDKDVFSNFISFQGFVELMYVDIVELGMTRNLPDFNWGEDIIQNQAPFFDDGNYRQILNTTNYPFTHPNVERNFRKLTGEKNQAYWDNGWAGIRTANIAISRLDDLVNATQEERDLIEGQAYFFRGFLHWEIMRAWGSIPYIDTLLMPDSDMKIPQLNFQQTADRVASDLQRAADLLPADWDETTVGSATEGANIGRITKGAALAVLAEVYLYAGSPLMNGVSGGGEYSYNVAYMQKAAEAAWGVIQLADQGYYELESWQNYSNIFYTTNGRIPGGREVILRPLNFGDSRWKNQTMQFSHLGGGAAFSSPTENYVERFEMANGLPIEDPDSGYDPMDRWNNRDPRFAYNILIDGERVVQSVNDARAYAQLYVGGRDRSANNSTTGYGYKKFNCNTCNSIDNGWRRPLYIYSVPRLRLAEIYLIYAEAVNEAYGPNGAHPGAGLTAVGAVDVVRARANMPGVHSKFTTDIGTFRARVWNERAVELAYENKRWYDIRRWYVAHLDEYKEMYALNFDQGHTFFNKVLYKTRVFDLKHYWLPFPTNQINLYEGWKQNPGW